ncbi:Armadillo repeat-containing protein LFR [Carex littledalei]|uniref:Armadillo repeat-containing protein LFR n=1 Tax=Carex littledalei TaxID=544730 RepID=A0A833RLI3_9POAL|nr:Armadillo repeat-containing protein LFR [Carex littledalei]
MQKPNKAGSASATPAKRGRPFGSTTGSGGGGGGASSSASPGDPGSAASLFGPSLHVYSNLVDENSKRIVLALQSGLKSEMTWALNAVTVLSFKEKDDLRRDSVPLCKIPGLLDAILQVVDDWRDIAIPRDYTKPERSRSLGLSALLTGFGNEAATIPSSDSLASPGGSTKSEENPNSLKRKRPVGWWFDEDGLFNLNEEGRAEKQICAIAASNIIRNFSFMPENETIMVQHRHCLETIFQCLEDQNTEDDELITNLLETLVNLAPVLDLRIFSSTKPSFIKMTEKRAVESIMGMLGSSIKAWHCAAAELIGRLIINPDNEPFLLPFIPQIHKRLVDLMSLQAIDAQAAAVGALYNLTEVNMDCRLKLASERWAVDRLIKIVRVHTVPEVCRKAAMILESLVSESQNRLMLMAHETTFSEILMSEGKYSETFARILYELTAKPNSKMSSARAVWGNVS